MMSGTSEAEATPGKQNGETFNEEMKVRMMERVLKFKVKTYDLISQRWNLGLEVPRSSDRKSKFLHVVF